jgi:DNA-binding transcriptional regulator YhcF (GntR family)
VARTDELVVEELDREVLIYDQRTNEAHCLSPAAAQAWRACDGKTSREQLATELELDVDTVRRALDELEACGLLDGSGNAGVTRREATTRFTKVGAAAVAAPLIYSIVAPTPALAASEATCFAICDTGCGSCSKAGCCCSAPGGGSMKLCSADLAACQALTPPFAHCGETITSTACSAGC